MPAPPPAADAPVFHPAYLRLLCSFLHEQGADVERLLAQAGIEPATLLDDRTMLPLASVRWLVVAARHALGRPTLALEAGARIAPSAHAALGTALRHSASLRDALSLLVQYLPMRTGLYRARLEPATGGLRYVVEPALALGEIEQFTLEHICASTSALLARLSGMSQPVLQLDLPWPRPAWHAAYAGLAGKLRFGQPQLCLFLTNEVLDQRLPSACADACAQARQCCDAALVALQQSSSLSQRILRVLDQLAPADWSLAVVSKRLGLSSRVLIRRLRAEGTGFQALLDAIRRQRALVLLHQRNLPIAAVATALGYRSGANFARSALRWFGLKPREIRARAVAGVESSSCDSAREIVDHDPAHRAIDPGRGCR